MKYFLLLILFFFGLSVTAAAQDIFPSREEIISQRLLSPDSITPQSLTEFSNRFYEDCFARGHEALSDTGQQMFCACASANISEILTPEDVKGIYDDTPEAQERRLQISELVYVPCMTAPFSDLIKEQCMENRDITKVPARARATCSCLADKVADYWTQAGGRPIFDAGQYNDHHPDRLVRFLRSHNYRNMFRHYTKSCVAENRKER